MTRNGRRQCQGETVDGEPCRTPIVGEDGFCEAHRPGGLQVMRARSIKGGMVTRELHKAGLVDLPPLESPADAQEWLERIGRSVTLGRLSASAGATAVRCVREWLETHKAVEHADRLERLEAEVKELREAGVI